MIGVILTFKHIVNQDDLELLFKTINSTSNFHFCLVNNKNSINTNYPLHNLDKLTNKVSVVDIKKTVNKYVLLKSAYRYLRGYINLDHIGYFEFNQNEDDHLFREVIGIIDKDQEIIFKLKKIENVKHIKRLINKKVFSIMDLFNVHYAGKMLNKHHCLVSKTSKRA